MPPFSCPPERWPIHTVVFDLDDTLFAEEEFVKSGFAAVEQWLQSRGVRGFESAARARFETGARGRIFDDVLAALEPPGQVGMVPQMVQVYREHQPQLNLLPDAAACLDALRPGFRLALLTDGYLAVQRRKFAALQIAERFQAVVFSDALGRESWKPSPVGFRLIMQQLPGLASGYLYVGDNPRKDFLAPRDLGWKTVRIRRPRTEHGTYEPSEREAADVDISDLRELRELIVPQPSGG